MEYDPSWRYKPPADTEKHYLAGLPEQTFDEFVAMVKRAASKSASGKGVLETFGRQFSDDSGGEYWGSSTYSFAQGDMKDQMAALKNNIPRFLDAFLRSRDNLSDEPTVVQELGDPSINALLEAHHIGYRIDGDKLLIRGAVEHVAVPVPSGWEKAWAEVDAALRRSDEALAKGEWRAAVREVWWVLESVSNSFTGRIVAGTKITADYFPQICSQLKKSDSSSFLAAVADSALRLFGDASAPSKGGVRHGISPDTREWAEHEAKFVCASVRAIARYFVEEYERKLTPE